MTDKILVLPFIVNENGNRESTSYPAELAGAVYLTEFQRKKTGLLGDEAEKVSFLSKLYYPIWIAPLEDSCVIIDGLASLSRNFTFKEPANIGLFVEDLKKNSVLPNEFMAALGRQAKKSGDKSTFGLSIRALITDKEVRVFFPTYLKKGLIFSGNKMVILPSEIDEQAAATVCETVKNYLRRNYAIIKGLQYALQVLYEETEFHKSMLLNEAELLKEKREAEVTILQLEVEKNVEKLKSRHEATIALVLKEAEKKTAFLSKKSEKYLQKLEGLEQRKASLQKKKRQTYMLEKYSQQINVVRKEIKLFSSMIENVKRESDKNIKKVDEEFRKAAALEEERISKLNSEYDAKIDEKKKQIANMTSETTTITKAFMGSIEEMKQAASVFKEQTVTNWKLDDLKLICVPIYVIGYARGSEERHGLLSPVTISEDESVLQELRERLTLTSEPRQKRLMRPASKELHEIIVSAVLKKMQNEEAFRRTITNLCHTNNLLKQVDFGKTLREGLTEAEHKHWVTPEEAAIAYRGITGEET